MKKKTLKNLINRISSICFNHLSDFMHFILFFFHFEKLNFILFYYLIILEMEHKYGHLYHKREYNLKST